MRAMETHLRDNRLILK